MTASFYRTFVLMLTLALSTGVLSAQTSSKIRRDQKRNRQQVEQAERNLKQNAREVENNLRELDLLEAQIADISIDLRQLRRRSDSIMRLIRPLNDSIGGLNARLDAMCDKYKTALRKSQTDANGLNDITFVFSSDNFKQAWERYRSLKQFSRWRSRKATEIVDTRTQLEARHRRLDSLKASNSRILARVQRQHDELERKRVEIDRITKSLKGQTKQLQQILKRRQQEAQQLEERLERALAEELEQRRRQEEQEAREREQLERERKQQQSANAGQGNRQNKKSQSSGNEKQKTNNAQVNRQLSGSFESNKGKLPFPVAGEFTIVKKYGRQRHPRLPKVETNNPGIDIEATRGATVRAVFDGEVSQIFKLAGYNNVVVVRHGDYVTVYANIASLSVKKGDKVATGQALGTLYVDKSDGDRSVLHFELRHEKDKQDPELWLRR